MVVNPCHNDPCGEHETRVGNSSLLENKAAFWGGPDEGRSSGDDGQEGRTYGVPFSLHSCAQGYSSHVCRLILFPGCALAADLRHQGVNGRGREH